MSLLKRGGGEGAEPIPVPPAVGGAGPARFTYRVEMLRSKLIGDKMDHQAVEKQINSVAAEGWQLKSVVETDVKGRLGPGGTTGLLLIFERPVG